MSNCQTCNHSVINDACGCGSGCPEPWHMSSACHHCPPKPQPPPCACRIIDGLMVPVWHPIHPMIPSLLECHQAAIDDLLTINCMDEDDRDQELACLLKQCESEITTCQFPGPSYLIALKYRVLALLELKQLTRLWRSGISAALLNGKTPSYKAPSLSDAEHGQRLEELQRRNSLPVIMGL
jgi:hypothetical protein